MACSLNSVLNPTDRSPRLAGTKPAIAPNATERDDYGQQAPIVPRKRRRIPSRMGLEPDHAPCDDATTRDPRKRRKRPSSLPYRPQEDLPFSINGDRTFHREYLPINSLERSPIGTSSSRSLSQTNLNHFSIFNALLTHPELLYEMTKQLEIDDLVSLYSISRDFHFLANGRLTALILGQSVTKAPESSRIFVHRCYRNLCMRDPAGRLNESVPGEVRWVPSFRWLRMVLFREEAVNDIIDALAYKGHRMPPRASLVIKKLWFTLDIPDNRRRIYLFHNESFWTENDIFVLHLFILKLDMRLTNPSTGNYGETRFRTMLLNQRSLSVLRGVLKREHMLHQKHVLEMFVRYAYVHPYWPPLNPIMGIPPGEVGRLKYEGWGAGHTPFVPVDNLAQREAFRRGLGLQDYYYDMCLFGYIDRETMKDILTAVAPEGFFGYEKVVKSVEELERMGSEVDFEENDSEGYGSQESDIEDWALGNDEMESGSEETSLSDKEGEGRVTEYNGESELEDECEERGG
ncbi:uncharacterized protein KY384_005271 [Bacidia gigantensis]|uniref:uncharacterized protein n=1 Tax=Bacidia gigantensis TaxID=2732470 RepID=UPI001D03A4C1|nr:uncharacterized protein KY384_005271 [Bacidia gigantensis]KAG8529790.1 hypothetical protein KY384_005271 [Bacidia gigantensis]